jgi:hypothetical protein
MPPHFTLASLDITNLYSNVPVKETRTILANTLKYNQTDPQTQQELLMWYDIITKQNYFTHNQDIITQHDGLAMGAPSSGLIAEFFLQHIEDVHLAHLSHKHRIINYFRYVDDILLIFDSNHTDIQTILTDFNALHPNLQFTAEVEKDSVINHLDISIHKTPNNLKTSIYRKPTLLDSIISYTSNHLTQHKYAAVKFLFNRLNSYNLHEPEYKQELNTIHSILHNNSFPFTPQKQHPNKTTRQQDTRTSRQKWAAFTYVCKETFHITNAFRHTDLKIAFRTNNTIHNLLKQKNPAPVKYSLSGVYKLTCPDCNKAYMGQTGRQFSLRYNERKRAFYNNSQSSSFAQHLHEKTHSFGPINSIMQVLHHQRKGTHLNATERFYIHTEYAAVNHLNDDHTIFPNKIFDTLIKPK